MEELSIRSRTNLINGRWIEVNEDATWNMLAVTSFGEECLIGADIDSCVRVSLSVRQQTMLQKIQFPG